jgi:hypothetical protein
MRKALVRNFSFLTASNLLLPIATMALVVAISRLGGAELLGEYSLLMSFFLIGQTCSTAGLQILSTRDVACPNLKCVLAIQGNNSSEANESGLDSVNGRTSAAARIIAIRARPAAFDMP